MPPLSTSQGVSCLDDTGCGSLGSGGDWQGGTLGMGRGRTWQGLGLGQGLRKKGIV